MTARSIAAIVNGESYSFDPTQDSITFGSTAYQASKLVLLDVGDDLQVTYGSKTFKLLGMSIAQILQHNFVFANGSVVSAGTAGNDVAVLGSSQADLMYGLDGNDTLNGGAGTDVMRGGAGHDLYMHTTGDKVVELSGQGDDTVVFNDSGTFTLAAYVEHGQLFSAASLTGNSLANSLTGSAGNDTLAGVGGDDALDGGAGNDSLSGGSGADLLQGGDGDDQMAIGPYDTAIGGAGYDLVLSSVLHTLEGTTEALRLTGTAVTGRGNALDNMLTGNAVGNRLYGGDGDDVIDGDYGDDTLSGGNGNDSLTGGGETTDILLGGAGNDTLDGGAGTDLMSGGAGNDSILVYNSEDIISGGTGIDTIVHVGAGGIYVLGGDLERFDASAASGPVDFFGNSLANLVTGTPYADWLRGDEGDDTLVGGAGADTLEGGYGDDLYVMQTLDAGATLYDSDGVDWVSLTGADLESFSAGNGIENIDASAATSGDGVTLYGDAGANHLIGSTANDLLEGDDGNDTLNGGAGADMMHGGYGDDIYYVDDVGDGISDADGTDTVRVTVSDLSSWNLGTSGAERLDAGASTNAAGMTLGGSLSGDTITGSAFNDTIEGADGDDSLLGGSGADSVVGGAGTDVLDGGAGADSMYGGAGSDIYYVNNGLDLVSEAGGDGIDLVISSVSRGLGEGFENLRLAGAAAKGTGNELANSIEGQNANNTLTGRAGDDTMYGYGGDDILNGGADDDELHGGDGNDTLIGGAGVDSLYGSTGDDVFMDDLLSTAPIIEPGYPGNLRIEGGAGNDTFRLANGQSLDLTTTPDISGIDRIDMATDDAANWFSFADVASISGLPDNHVLYIDGDENDHVQELYGSFPYLWQPLGTFDGYERYKADISPEVHAELYIAVGVQTSLWLVP